MGARRGFSVPVVICALLSACDQPASPTVTTGLTGIVVRGPVTPVCGNDAPCDAPFSATFNVHKNARRISDFKSDADGGFTVMLAAGVYQIVPTADAPVMSPSAQVKTVEVGPVGLTQVRLEFDTGIR